MQGSERRICRPRRAEITLSSRKTVDRFTTVFIFTVGILGKNLTLSSDKILNSAAAMISIK
ncbi:hypothetical protein [Burkholderia sp. Ac-20344]|uniref:hypothetical protein n=1 Tax=Burkholderia sp. Ac-20344 TaxID=2703890 RepID=UPI00197C9B17|nr:hypothetical protein [Burkholderia sp. Ac-20344]MBN3834539.1 hypothetical protein [Burkholderia sp. Ac-20344]